jgi:uncharacterized protein (DUF1015 family)
LATLKPFQPYRYSSQAGDPANLLTQPYDKINPAMQARYLARSPHNLVRIVLGERRDSDDDANNVYTRGSALFQEWIRAGLLAQDSAPGFYAYFQDFKVPDSGERLTRKSFIGLGKLEDYSAGVVFRHEQTLSGPKKDRLQVLRHSRAHFGQIFMLYPDRENAVDRELDQATAAPPLMDVTDEYGARHRLWAIADPSRVAHMQELMAPMKLLIADGHHRYETALNYRNENPNDPAAQYVMMTFVNMYSPGLKILATHRVLRDLKDFSIEALLAQATGSWNAKQFDSLHELKHALSAPTPQSVRIGVVTATGAWLLVRPRHEGELDVPVLHREIMGEWLGIDEEAVREEKYIQYVRGIDAAAAEVREKGAQVAFLLEPTPIDDMARIAFSGGVMPQKSTDFYPKLLTGIAIYRL